MATNEGRGRLLKIFVGAVLVVLLAFFIFFNFENIGAWMALNDPFQRQWTAVQLTDGEILYGHLSGVSGSTIGLSDVYSLDKVSPLPTTGGISASDGLSLEPAPGTPTAQPTLVPVSDTPYLFINRTAVVYFKFVTSDDPAMPYLH